MKQRLHRLLEALALAPHTTAMLLLVLLLGLANLLGGCRAAKPQVPVRTETRAVHVVDSVKVAGTDFTQTLLARDVLADSTDAVKALDQLDASFTLAQRAVVHRTVLSAIRERPRLAPGTTLRLHREGVHLALAQDSAGNLVVAAGRDPQKVAHSFVREVNTSVYQPAPDPYPRGEARPAREAQRPRHH